MAPGTVLGVLGQGGRKAPPPARADRQAGARGRNVQYPPTRNLDLPLVLRFSGHRALPRKRRLTRRQCRLIRLPDEGDGDRSRGSIGFTPQLFFGRPSTATLSTRFSRALGESIP